MNERMPRREFLDQSAKVIAATGAACCTFCGNQATAATAGKAATDSYCGLYCGACPAQLKSLAATKSSDVKCLGCKSGKLGKFCSKCEVRKCAIQQGVESCALCESYPCEKISSFTAAPYRKPRYGLRKKNLETIARDGIDNWKAQQKARWTCKKCNKRFGYADDKCPHCGAKVYTSEQEFKAYAKGV